MQSEDNHHSDNATKNRLILVCLSDDLEKVQSIVTEHAPLKWRDAEQIRVVDVDERSKFRDEGRPRLKNLHDVQKKIDDLAPQKSAARIVIVGAIPCSKSYGRDGDSRVLNQIHNTLELASELPPILQQSRLDWFSEVVDQLGHYHFSVSPETRVNRERINLWLSQFEQAKAPWIGVALLKLLDFWPTHRLCENLCQVPIDSGAAGFSATMDWFESYDRISFGNMSGGPSSLLVSRLAIKGLGEVIDKKRVNLEEYLVSDSTPSRLLFMEDCLMTGTELIKVLKNIDKNLILKHEIHLKFAFATQAGLMRLQAYLDLRGITSVKIQAPVDGFLPNLTEAGLQAAGEKYLLKSGESHEFASPLTDIVDGITLRIKNCDGAYNSGQRKAILKFCKAIGKPLMHQHFSRKGWPLQRVIDVTKDCALGPSNLGLLVAFAHGISKPVVPLFWTGGSVNVDLPFEGRGSRFVGEWEPLFPGPIVA